MQRHSRNSRGREAETQRGRKAERHSRRGNGIIRGHAAGNKRASNLLPLLCMHRVRPQSLRCVYSSLHNSFFFRPSSTHVYDPGSDKVVVVDMKRVAALLDHRPNTYGTNSPSPRNDAVAEVYPIRYRL